MHPDYSVEHTGRLDSIKQHLRKQARTDELSQIQFKLSIYRDSLNMFLIMLSL